MPRCTALADETRREKADAARASTAAVVPIMDLESVARDMLAASFRPRTGPRLPGLLLRDAVRLMTSAAPHAGPHSPNGQAKPPGDKSGGVGSCQSGRVEAPRQRRHGSRLRQHPAQPPPGPSTTGQRQLRDGRARAQTVGVLVAHELSARCYFSSVSRVPGAVCMFLAGPGPCVSGSQPHIPSSCLCVESVHPIDYMYQHHVELP